MDLDSDFDFLGLFNDLLMKNPNNKMSIIMVTIIIDILIIE
jgi:hypothetical protein